MIEGFTIIDAHCHPETQECPCFKNPYGHPVNTEEFFAEMNRSGIDHCCGSVVNRLCDPVWGDFTELNNAGIKLSREWPTYYTPGILVSPKFPEESRRELERLHQEAGLKWVGELVPYLTGYTEYATPEMFSILEVARDLDMVVNFHSTSDEDIEKLMQNMPGLKVVMAHPGETGGIPHRVEMMKKWQNLHWDISGTGLFRWGMLKHIVDNCGTDKLLFGTDFPICSIAMQIYGVLSEHISDDAKAAIFSGNFLRLTTQS